MLRLLGVPLLALLLGSLVACQSTGTSIHTGQGGAAPEPVAIIATQTGDDPGLTSPTVVLLNSPEELAALGATTAPGLAVDFKTQSVLLVAVGRQNTGGYWARIDGVQQAGRTLYLQATVNRPASFQPVTAAISHAYAAAVIAKTKAHLIPEIQSVEGQMP